MRSNNIVVLGSNIVLQSYLKDFGDLLLFSTAEEVPEAILSTAALVVFTGGSDINPDIYDSDEGVHQYAKPGHPKRDQIETDVFDECVRLGVPMLGICRGAQMLCALSGGKLIQSVRNHTSPHEVLLWDYDKDKFFESVTTSTHSQMMYPFNMEEIDYYCIGRSATKMSRGCYERGPNVKDYTDKDVPYEPEVIYFPFTECLSIQGHPEHSTASPQFIQYCTNLIKQHMALDVRVPEFK